MLLFAGKLSGSNSLYSVDCSQINTVRDLVVINRGLENELHYIPILVKKSLVFTVSWVCNIY
jgi:hypothetical protein